jgi:hypothetical protein
MSEKNPHTPADGRDEPATVDLDVEDWPTEWRYKYGAEPADEART